MLELTINKKTAKTGLLAGLCVTRRWQRVLVSDTSNIHLVWGDFAILSRTLLAQQFGVNSRSLDECNIEFNGVCISICGPYGFRLSEKAAIINLRTNNITPVYNSEGHGSSMDRAGWIYSSGGSIYNPNGEPCGDLGHCVSNSCPIQGHCEANSWQGETYSRVLQVSAGVVTDVSNKWVSASNDALNVRWYRPTSVGTYNGKNEHLTATTPTGEVLFDADAKRIGGVNVVLSGSDAAILTTPKQKLLLVNNRKYEVFNNHNFIPFSFGRIDPNTFLITSDHLRYVSLQDVPPTCFTPFAKTKILNIDI